MTSLFTLQREELVLSPILQQPGTKRCSLSLPYPSYYFTTRRPTELPSSLNFTQPSTTYSYAITLPNHYTTISKPWFRSSSIHTPGLQRGTGPISHDQARQSRRTAKCQQVSDTNLPSCLKDESHDLSLHVVVFEAVHHSTRI